MIVVMIAVPDPFQSRLQAIAWEDNNAPLVGPEDSPFSEKIISGIQESVQK